MVSLAVAALGAVLALRYRVERTLIHRLAALVPEKPQLLLLLPMLEVLCLPPRSRCIVRCWAGNQPQSCLQTPPDGHMHRQGQRHRHRQMAAASPGIEIGREIETGIGIET